MNNNCKILWISPYIPYDKVPHAGGKVHNYYIKYFKEKLHCDIKLLTFARKKELDKLDLNYYGIDCEYIVKDKNFFTILFRKMFNLESECNPFHRFGGGITNFDVFQFKKMIRKYCKGNYNKNPDFIIMQWTQAGLMINYLKRFYPQSKYIIIEEDVSFQGSLRKAKRVKGIIFNAFYKKRAERFKHAELCALQLADIITVNNFKDKKLLLEENIKPDKIVLVAPYFDDRTGLKVEKRNKNIIFYGAMDREENYLSAIWFIEEVFYYLDDQEIKFLIIGGNPNKKLREYESERVKVVGFVDDVGEYFKNSLCLVAPLLLGAGIKVKILEALSAGLPVLTNEIGAEGIGITDKIHYFYCRKPDDYISTINRLKEDIDLQKKIGNNGRQFIRKNFNINEKLDDLIDKMRNC